MKVTARRRRQCEVFESLEKKHQEALWRTVNAFNSKLNVMAIFERTKNKRLESYIGMMNMELHSGSLSKSSIGSRK